MRPLLLLSVALLSATSGLAQEPAPRKIETKEAKTLVSDFNKKIRAGKKSLRARLEAVQNLGRYSHKLLVKPLLAVAKTDPAKTIRQEAVKALGSQPQRSARPALRNMLKQADIRKEPALTAAIIRAIGRSSYSGRDWSELEKLFNQCLDVPAAADAQRAILETAGQNREIEAAEFLTGHIDHPAPVWVDDPANPPAAYWEARHKNWQKWRPQVIESLYQITGQRFGTTKEAREWLKANQKKLKSIHAEKDRAKEKTSDDDKKSKAP